MPVNRAKVMMNGFQTSRRYGRPKLGISGAYVAGDLAEALDLPVEGGFLVYEVQPDSPAAAAGIRGAQRYVIVGNTEVGVGGDLVLAIDGRPVDRTDAINRAMQQKKPGDSVEMTIFRGGRTAKVKVPLSSSTGSQAL